MMNERAAWQLMEEAEARAEQAEEAFEALGLPSQPIGRYAKNCRPTEYLFTFEQLVAFALEDRKRNFRLMVKERAECDQITREERQ